MTSDGICIHCDEKITTKNHPCAWWWHPVNHLIYCPGSESLPPRDRPTAEPLVVPEKRSLVGEICYVRLVPNGNFCESYTWTLTEIVYDNNGSPTMVVLTDHLVEPPKVALVPWHSVQRSSRMTDRPARTRETRYRYENTEEPPEGWRFLRNEFNNDGFFALWTEAPAGESAHGRPNKWITLRQVVQERYVTEWVDTDDRGSR